MHKLQTSITYTSCLRFKHSLPCHVHKLEICISFSCFSIYHWYTQNFNFCLAKTHSWPHVVWIQYTMLCREFAHKSGSETTLCPQIMVWKPSSKYSLLDSVRNGMNYGLFKTEIDVSNLQMDGKGGNIQAYPCFSRFNYVWTELCVHTLLIRILHHLLSTKLINGGWYNIYELQ